MLPFGRRVAYMGAWGGGLYESDFACDLRADITGYMRAPLSDDELLAKLAEAHGQGHDGEHVEGFDYWLVLADQLERRGIPRQDIFDRAIAIIERNEDIAALEKLGAGKATAAERRKVTAELLQRLRNPRPAKKRRPLKKPQPLLFEVGDALIWPTDKGTCNSEYPAWGIPFQPDGWGFGVITAAGHDYDVFAHYAIRHLMWRSTERPTLKDSPRCRRSYHYGGGLSQRRLEFVGVQKIGQVGPDVLGPPPEHWWTIGLNFGLDAFNSFSEKKYGYPPASGVDMFPEEPDQRPLPDPKPLTG
jgi:hypothetical protein